jgi:hypothetical protein
LEEDGERRESGGFENGLEVFQKRGAGEVRFLEGVERFTQETLFVGIEFLPSLVGGEGGAFFRVLRLDAELERALDGDAAAEPNNRLMSVMYPRRVACAWIRVIAAPLPAGFAAARRSNHVHDRFLNERVESPRPRRMRLASQPTTKQIPKPMKA